MKSKSGVEPPITENILFETIRDVVREGEWRAVMEHIGDHSRDPLDDDTKIARPVILDHGPGSYSGGN